MIQAFNDQTYGLVRRLTKSKRHVTNHHLPATMGIFFPKTAQHGHQTSPKTQSPNHPKKSHNLHMEFLQCEAPKISKLVYNSNNYGLWYL